MAKFIQNRHPTNVLKNLFYNTVKTPMRICQAEIGENRQFLS